VGGDINVVTDQLIINNGGTIEASNFGSFEFLFQSAEQRPRDILTPEEDFFGSAGVPGNIDIEANSLSLNNEGGIIAATQSERGNGANINLQIAQDIRLENDSFISAQALANADGGNITINADQGFILASPSSNGNNDIFARAAQGNGGRISIDTQALFGIEERLSTPPNETNDIDASSEFGLQGDFSLSTPDFDPTSGLINLPTSVGDASDQISQNPCQQGVGSEFKITGKGGLPPTVNEALNSESSEVGLIEAVPSQRQTGEANNISADLPISEATPAMGWVFNDRGEVTLTAHATSNTKTQRPGQQNQNTCSSGIYNWF